MPRLQDLPQRFNSDQDTNYLPSVTTLSFFSNNENYFKPLSET